MLLALKIVASVATLILWGRAVLADIPTEGNPGSYGFCTAWSIAALGIAAAIWL